VRLQVEVELCRVHDVGVDDCPGWAVAAAVAFIGTLREHADVMALANNDDGETRRGVDAKVLKGTWRERVQHTYGVSIG